MGRFRGLGVYSSTALPYALGASSSGDGAGDGVGGGRVSFWALRLYEMLNVLHWQAMQAEFSTTLVSGLLARCIVMVLGGDGDGNGDGANCTKPTSLTRRDASTFLP
jgi:hypothetical protein